MAHLHVKKKNIKTSLILTKIDSGTIQSLVPGFQTQDILIEGRLPALYPVPSLFSIPLLPLGLSLETEIWLNTIKWLTTRSDCLFFGTLFSFYQLERIGSRRLQFFFGWKYGTQHIGKEKITYCSFPSMISKVVWYEHIKKKSACRER